MREEDIMPVDSMAVVCGVEPGGMPMYRVRSMVLEKEWKSAVAKGGELGSLKECRITEG